LKLCVICKDEIQSARKPWVPSGNKPKDLIASEKLLFSKQNANINQPTQENYLNSLYKTKFGLPLESFRSTLKPNRSDSPKRSKSIHGVSLIYCIYCI
jgi:hypothetical protein